MRTLQKDVGSIYVVEEVVEEPGCPYFGLASADLTIIKPNYEAMIKSGHLKVNDSTNSGTVKFISLLVFILFIKMLNFLLID